MRFISLLIIDLIIWYLFIYLWLYTIKNDVNLWLNSAILLVLAVIGTALLYPALDSFVKPNRDQDEDDTDE